MEFDGNVACTNPVSTSAVTKQSQNFINYKKAFVGFTAGSRSHSPHFSPDRITRHASPSRLELAQREVSIVPRIPQPYRTSFSAVTAPLRIPKDTSSELNLQSISSAINLLGVNRRTTSPGRIKPVTCRPGPEPLQYSSSADILYTSNEITELRRDESLDILQNSNPVCDIKSTMPLHVPESCHHDERHFCNNSETLIPFDIINATEDITDATIVDDGKLFAKQTTSETCISLNFAAEEVKSTRQAENWPLFGKFKSFRSDRRPIMGRSHGVSPNSGIKPNDSKISNSGITSVSNEVRGRSKTMPSQAVISENSINASRNPKSLSMSITSFFKKMSPKSLRRFGGMVAKSNQNSQEATTSSDSLVEFSELGSGNTSLSKGCTSGDCFASDTSGLSDNSHFRNSVESGRSSRSLKKSPRLPSVKRMFAGRNRQRDAEKHAEKNDVEGIKPPSENVASGQLLTPEMNLMMKSIEDGSARVSQKSVYQAFKEKRSPVRASESALGMKPQSLQTVEFPDNLLQPNLSNANGSNLNSGLLSSVDGVQNDIQPVSSCPNVGSGPCISPAVRQVLEPSGRRQDPPRTLNVQSVQMIGKQLFHFPSMSVESIGQCSLDVADAGSEASLVQNGHFSSVSASKRTLTSQDNILDSAAKSSPLPATDSCGSLAEASDSVYSAGDFSNVEPRAAPSYLKLSRAIGGYTPYNTYTSVTEHARLRTDNCFGGSKLQSSDKQYRGDSEAILQNGEPVVTIKQQPHETPVYGSTEQHSPSVLLDSCGDTSAGQVVPSGNNFCLSSFVDARSSNQIFSPVAFSGLSCGAVPSVSILPPSDLKGSEALVTTLDDGMPNSCDVPFERSFLSICNDLADSEASPKNGHYFLILVDNAERWLKLHCDRTEVDLQATISDEVEGKMRTAIGKGNLLIQKKFPQFRQLCHANLSQKEGDPFKTTEQDLSGFWDMVLLQVEDVNKHFEEIEQLRQNGWNEIKTSLEICPESATLSSSSKPSGTRTRMQKSNSATNVRSPALSSSAAAKAREEARKRLMAAKAVGRQRKASESDKDIEIFVS